MKIKNVNKTVIEVTKQEIIDELINNFKEPLLDKGNKLNNVLEAARYLYESLSNIDSSDYQKLFTGSNSFRCLPEDVFDEVEAYFFSDEDEGELNEENVISFVKASKEISETELEIVIKDEKGVVARIPEHLIQY